MKKYKLNKDKREELSEEEIRKYKDFGKLVYNYQRAGKPLYKKPLYKDPKAFLVILIIALLTYLIVEFVEEGDKKDVPKNEIEKVKN